MSKKSFSIIVPVYCAEKYLERCLDSIIAQKYSDYEVILIDDGSTDQSGRICDEYTERSRNFKVVHQTNQGVSHARNAGLDLAEKEYVLFIDADDYVKEGYLEHLSDRLNENEDICFGLNHISENGEVRKVVSNGGDEACISIKEGRAIRKYFSVHNTEIPEAVCCNCYRNDFIKKYHIRFSEKFSIGEDVDFMFQAFFRAKRVSWMEEPFYYYDHSNEASATSRWNARKIISIVNVYRKWYDILRTKASKHGCYQGYVGRMADKANTCLLFGSQVSREEAAKLDEHVVGWYNFLKNSTSVLKRIACRAYVLFGYHNVIHCIKFLSEKKNWIRDCIKN